GNKRTSLSKWAGVIRRAPSATKFCNSSFMRIGPQVSMMTRTKESAGDRALDIFAGEGVARRGNGGHGGFRVPSEFCSVLRRVRAVRYHAEIKSGVIRHTSKTSVSSVPPPRPPCDSLSSSHPGDQ